MNILLLGGSGFIGHAVKARLLADGHQVTAPRHGELDFIHPDLAKLKALMQGQDAVVNTVGIMHHRTDLLETIHHHAPLQFAGHAKEAGVAQWIQLSALGADSDSPVAFVGCKGHGDAALLRLADDGFKVKIARPSVVFGRGGNSTRAFLRLARLPRLCLPERGNFTLQPVHVDDVAEGLCRLLQNDGSDNVVNMVGKTRHSLAEYLNILREQIHGKPPLRVHQAPDLLVKIAARGLRVPSKGFISPDSMTLLRQGSSADVQPFTQLLGKAPLAAPDFRL
ncbi:NAD-dependent epimerase/dehydratase family protein [Cardiobacteriaceae bacterium TAE3-ERU3]|nr:NAD-dependent epimerase/dehydratase family protein [Cardiobacteriaceae bacterium TAE3-ERU3]